MGDPGTNGTNTIAFIKPYQNATSGNSKIILNGRRSYIATTSWLYTADIIQYTDANQLIDGYRFVVQQDNKIVTLVSGSNGSGPITWKIPFKTQKTSSENYTSYFEIANPNNIYQLVQIARNSTTNTPVWSNDNQKWTWQNPAYTNTLNILRATFKPVNTQLTYYAQYPLCYVYSRSLNHRIKLKSDSGFTYVVYSENGSNPRYDGNNQFTVVFQNASGTDIADRSDVTYEWGIFQNQGLEIVGDNNKKTVTINPKPYYDGKFLQTAIYCNMTYQNSQGETQHVGMYIPIYFSFNRYNHRNLNKWDGNSIQLDQTGGYILAPEVGAGKKNDTNNTFTGVLMGQIVNGDGNSQTGLMTYKEGLRTIFLDAQTGNAEFGARGSGQIKINGTNATITSGDYNWSNTDGTGMKIDLNTPYIRFGNKNFYVNNDGILHAKGANITLDSTSKNGIINGLAVSTYDYYAQGQGEGQQFIRGTVGMGSLQKTNSSFNQYWGTNYTTLQPSNMSYTDWVNNHDGTNQDTNAGNVRYLRIWAGTKSNSTEASQLMSRLNFMVDHEGILYAKNAYVSGHVVASDFTADLRDSIDTQVAQGFVVKTQNTNQLSSDQNMLRGSVGIGVNNNTIQKDWLWNNYKIYKIIYPNMDASTKAEYVDFRIWSINNNALKFGVTAAGTLFSNGGYIDGKLYSTEGRIAGWNLKDGYFESSNTGGYFQINTSKSNGKTSYYLWAGPDSDTRKFSVSKGGVLWATGATIDGEITANEGRIGGWQLDGSRLRYYANFETFTKGDMYAYISANTNDSYRLSIGKLKTTGSKTSYDHMFCIDKDGKISAKGGEIASWQIGNGYLYSHDDAGGYFQINTSNTNGKKAYFLWGGENSSTAKFYVTKAGKLWASGATITGTITATNSTFSGTITAEEGKIGGWSISKNVLTGGSTSGQHMYLHSSPSSSSTAANGGYYIWVGNGSTRKFSVGATGKVIATDITITGGSIDFDDVTISNLTVGKLKGTSPAWRDITYVSWIGVGNNGKLNWKTRTLKFLTNTAPPDPDDSNSGNYRFVYDAS